MLEVFAATEAGRRSGGRRWAGSRRSSVGVLAGSQASDGGTSAAVHPGRRCCQRSRMQAGRGASSGSAHVAGRLGGHPWRICIVIPQIAWIRIRPSIGFFLQLFCCRYFMDTYPLRIPSVSVSDTYPIRDTWPTSRRIILQLIFVSYFLVE